jgi:hypothetical protein
MFWNVAAVQHRGIGNQPPYLAISPDRQIELPLDEKDLMSVAMPLYPRHTIMGPLLSQRRSP